MNDLTEKLTAKEAALKAYDEMMPSILSANIELQHKALEVVRDKIDACSAQQAATIYGILHDKAQMMIGPREQNNQFNIFMGDMMDMGDTSDLMRRVASRMMSEETDMEVIDK